MTDKYLTGSAYISDVNRGTITGMVASKAELEGTVHIDSGRETYNGEYVVIPKASEQVLHAAGKVMVSDVTVEEIPYAEVSNPAGGVTVIIG